MIYKLALLAIGLFSLQAAPAVADPCKDCVPWWGQCGGTANGFEGTKCCQPGSSCQWLDGSGTFLQCLPDPKYVKKQYIDDGSKVCSVAWDGCVEGGSSQCCGGGQDGDGILTCYAWNQYYSQCLPPCDAALA